MQVSKYFIAILPDSAVSIEINSFRKKFLEGLNQKLEHKKFPHITLQHTFSRAEEMEEEMRPHLRSLAKSFQPFEINYSGIGHFDHRVIYIGIGENPLLLKLHQELKNMLLKDLKFAPKEVAVGYHPHITLEKKISKSDFTMFWNKIKDEKIEGTFQCTSFSLMRHNGKIWEEVEKVDFRSSSEAV